MATVTRSVRNPVRRKEIAARKNGRTAEAVRPQERIPRAMRQKVEQLLEESYAFMDSPTFAQPGIEKQLFDFEVEPQLPLTSWYQPTRDEALDEAMVGAPQLMKAAEEKLMFL